MLEYTVLSDNLKIYVLLTNVFVLDIFSTSVHNNLYLKWSYPL